MTTTATTAPAATTTAATTAPAKPKQYTVGISETGKRDVTELRQEFTRPASVKGNPPVAMSEKELIEVLFKVASDRRYKIVEETNETGETALVTVDLFEVEWSAIKARDYVETPKVPTVEGLIAQIRKYGAALNLSEERIQSMIQAAGCWSIMQSPLPHMGEGTGGGELQNTSLPLR